MKKQEYAKNTFDNVAIKYDKIEFFKISAKHVADIIKKHKSSTNLNILDVASGTGNVVLECASSMPQASFDAIDISSGMLKIAEQKAKSMNIENISFLLQDITKLEIEKKYDVVTCSYALFFLPDSINVLKKLATLLDKNGVLIFTTFTKEAFSPSSNIILELLKKYGSSSALLYNIEKWENLRYKKDIEYICQKADIKNIDIETKEIRYALSIDQWWELFNNTGYSGMLAELSQEDYTNVKKQFYESISKYAQNNSLELIADTYFVSIKLD
jgi:ubiquinone/menaquinone biosynthesis C-methylase UbiE